MKSDPFYPWESIEAAAGTLNPGDHIHFRWPKPLPPTAGYKRDDSCLFGSKIVTNPAVPEGKILFVDERRRKLVGVVHLGDSANQGEGEMTPECLKQLRELRRDERFSDLTIEQLLWEAVRSSDPTEVQTTLDHLHNELVGEMPLWAAADTSSHDPHPPSSYWRKRLIRESVRIGVDQLLTREGKLRQVVDELLKSAGAEYGDGTCSVAWKPLNELRGLMHWKRTEHGDE